MRKKPEMVNGLLDEWIHDSEVRITIEWLHPLRDVSEQFVSHPKSLRTVWNYIWRVGPVSVWRKVISRWAERSRNEKWACVGRGRIIESRSPEKPQGLSVLFFAPSINPNAMRVVLDQAFVVSGTGRFRSGGKVEVPSQLNPYLAWSRFSGIPIDKGEVLAGMVKLSEFFEPMGNMENQHPSPSGDAIVTRQDAPPTSEHKLTAGIFGLGHYAKHVILPNLTKDFRLSCIHEIDPHQLAGHRFRNVTLDTSPEPHPDERYDLWFASGYHHTHAALAAHALALQSAVAVEKPIATNRQEMDVIRKAIIENPNGKFFACFQRRYSEYNDWIYEDLRADNYSGPLNYNCISYDIPLSHLHWYSWPSSRSRLISNGCHWIDHFMFLNDYSEIIFADSIPLKGEGALGILILANGAELTLRLTEEGSSRIGVREYIEISANGRTATIRDNRFYQSMDSRRVLRQKKINVMGAYSVMYRDICRRVASNMPGDSLASLASSDAAILLDEILSGSSPPIRPNAHMRRPLDQA